MGSVAAGLAALYLLACVAGRLGYRALVYPAPQVDDAPLPAGARVLGLRAADGAAVHAIEVPNPTARRTVVYFHGNGEVAGDELWIAERLVAEGFAVVLAEYRGYGRSRAAAPSEEGLYADATAILDDLAARGVGPDRVVLWGISLGTGVATEMAHRGRGAALVLVAPYTSMSDMAARVAPFLPTRWIVGDRFDNAAKAPSVRVPAVVVHGALDPVIPVAMGERIAASLPGARFERVARGHHMDAFLVDDALLARVCARVRDA